MTQPYFSVLVSSPRVGNAETMINLTLRSRAKHGVSKGGNEHHA
jgi:hypothetical protein